MKIIKVEGMSNAGSSNRDDGAGSAGQDGVPLRRSHAGKSPHGYKRPYEGMVDPDEVESESGSYSEGDRGKRTKVWHSSGHVDLQAFLQASGLDIDQQIALLVAYKAYLMASKPKKVREVNKRKC